MSKWHEPEHFESVPRWWVHYFILYPSGSSCASNFSTLNPLIENNIFKLKRYLFLALRNCITVQYTSYYMVIQPVIRGTQSWQIERARIELSLVIGGWWFIKNIKNSFISMSDAFRTIIINQIGYTLQLPKQTRRMNVRIHCTEKFKFICKLKYYCICENAGAFLRKVKTRPIIFFNAKF